MESLEDSIRELWNDYLQEGLQPTQVERRIYAQAKKRNWSLPKVMKLLRDLRFPQMATRDRPQRTKNIRGCQENDDGEVLDPYTLQPIPEEFLVSFKEGDIVHCFDVRSIARAVVLGREYNPLTRMRFPEKILRKAQEYKESVSKTLKVGSSSIEIFLDSNFNVLVKCLRIHSGNVLDALSKINPFYSGVSLYSLGFDAEFETREDQEILFYPFLDGVEQALSHKKLFEYCSKNRTEGGIEESLFHELGYLLRVSPIFFNPEGTSYTLDPEESVYGTIKKIYEWLGGLEMVKRYNLVLEDGTQIATMQLGKKVSEEIPSLEIRYVLYDDEEDFEEVKSYLFEAAFELDDEEMIRVMSKYPEERLSSRNFQAVEEDLNYTLRDLVEYYWDVFLEGESIEEGFEILFESRWKDFASLIFDKPSDEDEFISFLQFVDTIWIRENNNWRRTLQNYGREAAKWHLYYFMEGKRNEQEQEVEDVLDGGLFTTLQYTDRFEKLDDVELFLRHYTVDNKLLPRFLQNPNSKVYHYLLENEPARTLFRATSGPLVSISDLGPKIIDKLSNSDIEVLFQEMAEGKHYPLSQQLIKSDRFPQSILDDESYYSNNHVILMMVANDHFRKFNELFAIFKKSMSSLLAGMRSERKIEVYKATRNLEVLKVILRSSLYYIERYADDLYIEPTIENFDLIKDVDYLSVKAFLLVSKMTKDQALQILCAKVYNLSVYFEMGHYFNFEEEDVKFIIECQPKALERLFLTAIYPFSVFKEKFELLETDELKEMAKILYTKLRRRDYAGYETDEDVLELGNAITEIISSR